MMDNQRGVPTHLKKCWYDIKSSFHNQHQSTIIDKNEDTDKTEETLPYLT